MSFVYNWNVSNGDKVVVEYCFSSVDKCIKVVDMTVNGKYHRTSWMSDNGRSELMELLTEDYKNQVGITERDKGFTKDHTEQWLNSVN